MDEKDDDLNGLTEQTASYIFSVDLNTLFCCPTFCRLEHYLGKWRLFWGKTHLYKWGSQESRE